MVIRIEKPLIGGEVKAIASKSQAHRLLICAALSDKATYIECEERSDDIDATVGCLESIGASISHDGVGFTVEPIKFPPPDELVTQVCGESGATLRFMLPVCCALGIPADFKMIGQLRERPTSPLLEQLAANGCSISMSKGNTICSGQLQSGEYNLHGNVSSQFISGLLLALPMLEGESVINVEGKVESMPYVTMTLDALKAFGIKVKQRGGRARRGAIFLIEGSQRYKSPGKVKVEGDWSNAAPWLCAGAIAGNGVTCTGLNLGSSQGDMATIRLLSYFGADVAYGANSVTVTPVGKLRGIQIDAADTPDIVPVLAVVASVTKGETVIINAERLRLKESDRLNAVTDIMRSLGADISQTQDGFIIKGKKTLKGGTVPSYGDHRLVMMAAVASAVCENPVIINVAEAINKSYPRFFKDFEQLGGKILEV